MVSCILLSAGESQRFGSPKALAKISHHSAIEEVQNSLLSSMADEIVVVLGAHSESIKRHVFNHKRVRIVYNKDYKLGQTSSLQAGLSVVDKADFLMIPVDCPFVQTATIDTLIRYFKQHQPSVLVPTYQGQRGHPPVLNASLKKEILALGPSIGLNHLFLAYPPVLLEIDDPGIIQTFNTPAELKELVVSKRSASNQ